MTEIPAQMALSWKENSQASVNKSGAWPTELMSPRLGLSLSFGSTFLWNGVTLPQPLSMQQLPKSFRLISSSISKESLSLAVPLHVQELSVTGSWLSPVSILEPLMVATKMQSSDWSGRSHMTPPGGDFSLEEVPKRKISMLLPRQGVIQMSPGISSQWKERSKVQLLKWLISNFFLFIYKEFL